MAANNITIEFKSSGAPALKTAIKALANEQDRLNDKFKGYVKQSGALDTATNRNRKGMGEMGNAFATVRSKMLLFNFAMGLGVAQVIKFTQEATKVQDMARAFNTLQGGGTKATIAIDKLQKATNGTVTQFDLFQQANNAMILGVTKNSDEMAEMFDMAQRLGQALGKDTASSVESLITGIGRQSRLMLDNIGIIVKADEAYQKYADTNGLVADKLTDAEKKQAFFEATMDSARKKVKQLGDEELTNSQRLAQMSTAINEAAISLGETLMPLVIPLAKGLELIARGASSVIDAFNPDKIGGASQEFDSLTEKQKDLEFQMSQVALQIINMGGEFRDVFGVTSIFFQQQNSDTRRLVESYNNLNQQVKDTKQEILDEPSGVQGFLQKQLEDINKLLEEQEKKALKAGNAVALAAMRSGAAYKNAGLAAQDAAEKALTAEAQKLIASYITSIFQNVPFPANIVLAAGAGAAAGSLLQGAVGEAKKLKFEDGGLVGGRRHSQGGTMIEAEQGEFVMSRNAVNAVGVEAMNRINQGGGAGNVNISFSGNVMSQDFIEDEAIPMIKEAIRRGADIGVS